MNLGSKHPLWQGLNLFCHGCKSSYQNLPCLLLSKSGWLKYLSFRDVLVLNPRSSHFPFSSWSWLPFCCWYLLLSLLPDKPNWLAKLSKDLLLEVCSSKYLSLRTDLAKPNSSEGFIDLSWDLALWDLSNPFPCWFLSGLADLLNLKSTNNVSSLF